MYSDARSRTLLHASHFIYFIPQALQLQQINEAVHNKDHEEIMAEFSGLCPSSAILVNAFQPPIYKGLFHPKKPGNFKELMSSIKVNHHPFTHNELLHPNETCNTSKTYEKHKSYAPPPNRP